jgi:hypothetical protein
MRMKKMKAQIKNAITTDSHSFSPLATMKTMINRGAAA